MPTPRPPPLLSSQTAPAAFLRVNGHQEGKPNKPATNFKHNWSTRKFLKGKKEWVLHTFPQTNMSKGFVPKSFKFIPDLVFKVK